MSTGLIIAAILAGGLGVYGGARYASGKMTDANYDSIRKSLDDANLKNLDVHRIVGDMYNQGLLTPDEYKKAIPILTDYEDQFGNKASGWKNFWGRLAHQIGSNKQADELFSKIYQQLPQYLNKDQIKSVNDIVNGFYSAVPNIAGVPAPNYLDTNPDNVVADLKEVEPVKLWSNAELAAYNNMNYDPNSYYDLVKDETSAALNNARYQSAQMNEAAMIGDSKATASYLDAIRNNRAEAVSSGATEGARAAADLLAMNKKNDAYTQQQGQLAQNRFNAVDQYIKQDAEAKLTARKQYENLAKNLFQDSALLYANDTSRFGQDWLSNAERYTADTNLLGNRIKANYDMSGAYAQAQAAVNAARQSATQEADEYAWVFNRFLDRNGYTGKGTAADDNAFYKARAEMSDYISSRYTGQTSNYDYLKNIYLQ